jgi:hypothetical protein
MDRPRSSRLQLIAIILAPMACGGGGGADAAPRDDSICVKLCAAQEKVPCEGGSSESDCVARCKVNREAEPKCNGEYTAFLECFITQPISCSLGVRVISSDSCTAEVNALRACRGIDGG